ncbi:MAG: methionine--tRNA ligase [Candidatus Micrarchaeia archaeon]
MKFYLSTPLYYTNAPLHIGHAYTTILSDALARFKRMQGSEVFFLTGTDEHGLKVWRAAEAAGKPPKQFVDELIPGIKALWAKLGISYDHFIRTTDSYHEKQVQQVLQRLYDEGDIYKGVYEGWYCLPCESFFTDTQLVDGKCPDCGRPVSRQREESYFFKMSKYREPLLKHFHENPGFVEPSFRTPEVINFFKDELKDLSISRASLKWGIPLPFDESHVTYVWFDALFNYWTGLAFDGDIERQKKFWPADVHVIGKEILRFHAVYWPAMLLAAGLPLPKKVFAHGWLTVDGRKMSKSLGNVVDPHKLADKYGADALRYFLLREIAVGADGDFSENALVQRLNNDLAAEYGNLLNRTLVMIERYAGGVVPASGVEGNPEKELASMALKARDEFVECFEKMEFHHGLEKLWVLVRAANKYASDTEPWALAKNNDARLKTVLAHLHESLRVVTLLASPVMPFKAQEAWQQLGMPGLVAGQSIESARWGAFAVGVKIKRGSVLFAQVK